jgi:hypothetical protein
LPAPGWGGQLAETSSAPPAPGGDLGCAGGGSTTGGDKLRPYDRAVARPKTVVPRAAPEDGGTSGRQSFFNTTKVMSSDASAPSMRSTSAASMRSRISPAE